MKKITLRAFSAILCWASLVGCGGSAYRQCDGVVWNTTYHIVYASGRELDDSVMAVINRVDASLSAFNSRSIVSAINRNDTAATAAVADALFSRVWECSMEVWRASGGNFDPTLGPAINLWGFGPDKSAPREVTDAAVDSVRRLVGLGDCRLEPGGRVTKKHPDTRFNFSAIAKGQACDEVGAMLSRNGVKDYLVEIGGEIAASGMNPRGESWRVMIDDPLVADPEREHRPLRYVKLARGGLATSGNYRNFRELPGRGRVGHTILPSTCRPAPQAFLSVTVAAPTAMLADALATACMTTDTAGARSVVESFGGASALLFTTDSTMVTIGNFPAE